MSGVSFDWVTGTGADLGANGEDSCSGDRYCVCELCRVQPPERFHTTEDAYMIARRGYGLKQITTADGTDVTAEAEDSTYFASAAVSI